ncbi:YigZ family protein [Brevibacterium mcbrellneri ATCC 49030]|uniref:YigZ family protein n=1 Tax=Brevibacterium mcbrellneri ATCC 49030 TaxID=585530 RepID=D4YN21_9MICO|nr:YigZ family protein [Brevibacterium mcbrellneri]EFG47339.1 YigZ family protein [Brevibacterium mcbrellneri ATCC 49030]
MDFDADLLDGFPVTSYTTVKGDATAEIEIKKSRFIGRVAHIENEQAAREVIEQERSKHPKARHWCTAFVLDPDARTQRCNDDGEPSGTAGIPMLDVLTGNQLTYVVAVVTRYFGGTLLGAGGLVRAYGAATSAALEGLTRVTRQLVVPVTVSLDYARAEVAKTKCEQHGWAVIDAQYAQAVTLTFGVAPAEVEEMAAVLADLSAGQAHAMAREPRYA